VTNDENLLNPLKTNVFGRFRIPEIKTYNKSYNKSLTIIYSIAINNYEHPLEAGWA